ncbi:MAG: nitroreductase family protein [Actinomyces sp.]|nr:MAG: nitroreductase family protein [Actinomyces sp.]
MVRAFAAEPLEAGLVDTLVDLARRGPSAGNTWGLDVLVCDDPDSRRLYWDTTLDPGARATFPWPGLLDAPALLVFWADPDAYLQRYREPDKAHTGLGAGLGAWPVPYWFVDAGAAIENVLIAAPSLGLGCCLFGLFEHEAAVARAFGVPPGRRGVGTVAVGRPAPDRPSRSARRGRPPLDSVLHRGRW